MMIQETESQLFWVGGVGVGDGTRLLIGAPRTVQLLVLLRFYSEFTTLIQGKDAAVQALGDGGGCKT